MLVLIALLAAAPSLAGTREAADKVRTGIAAYRLGDYAHAAAAFQEADVARPDDPRIAFDRAMALAGRGDAAKAVELLEKAALSADLDVALRARYNLGCLAAAKARAAFGAHPENAAADIRKSGLADLGQAVGHFRDCLRLDPEHADARHNLEVIRLWIKAMDALWQQADQKKQRDQADLPAYLQMLEEKQRLLRLAAQALPPADDSPKGREIRRALEEQQSKLGQEIEPLKEKIAATLSKAAAPGASAPPGPAAVPEELKQAIAHLQALADKAGQSITAAADQLHAGKPTEAVKPQTAAVETFNELYRGVAPYPTLVQRAVGAQQGLVDQQRPPEGEKNEKNPAAASPPPDAADAAWNQQFVTHYAELLGPLAKEGLKQLQAMPADAKPAGPSPPQPGGRSSAPSAGPTGGPSGGPSPEELQKQRQGLKQSMQLAATVAPKVAKLSGEAAGLLGDHKAAQALPKQQEALKLLKEIAEPLPKQKQEQGSDKQDQKNQDQNKPDQKPQEQKPQDQKQPDQKQQQPDAGEQQTEAAIRQVQERQQKRQEMEKQLQRYLPSSGKVDKDW